MWGRNSVFHTAYSIETFLTEVFEEENLISKYKNSFFIRDATYLKDYRYTKGNLLHYSHINYQREFSKGSE